MTISSTVNRVSYSGNGSTTAFSFGYLFFSNADLKVILVVDSTGVETTKTITTHYTITGAGDASGGTVTMGTAPASGETLVIIREVNLTQGLDLVENDAFPSDLVEQELDRATMMAQQLNTELARSVKLSDGDTSGADPTLPTPTGGAFFRWNLAGTALESSQSSAAQYLGGDGTVSLPFYTFTADPDTGFYRIGTGDVGYSINGVTAGTVVGTSATQTLSGKTLTAPAINGVVGGTQTSATITALTATTVNGVTAATAQYTSAEETKLSGIEASADVTDATNVTAAGALMDSELTSIADVKALNQSVASTGSPTFVTVAATDVNSTNLDGILGADTARAITATTIGGTVITASTSLAAASGATITGFDTTQALGTSDTLSVTQNAVKTYVDNQVAASAVWSDVVYLTSASSPYTIAANGTLFVCDTSGGAITVNLPAIASVGGGWASAIKKSTADTNSVTVVPSGAEEIDEIAGSVTIGTQDSGRTFLSDTDATPDSWSTMQFGATGGNMTVQNYSSTGDYTIDVTTALTTSSSPASEDNVVVTFNGVTQHHDTYSLSGTTVTFTSPIPVTDVEIRWGGTLSINTPADGTVGTSQLSAGPAKDINQLAVTDGGIIVGDGSNFVLESGATARTSLGVAIGSDVQAYDADLDDVASIKSIVQNSKSAAYALVLTDAGKHIYHPAADTTARIWTIPANASVAYPIGTAITFVNETLGGVITIAITTDTMVLAPDGTTGSRTLAASGMATALKVTATSWMISGAGLT